MLNHKTFRYTKMMIKLCLAVSGNSYSGTLSSQSDSCRLLSITYVSFLWLSFFQCSSLTMYDENKIWYLCIGTTSTVTHTPNLALTLNINYIAHPSSPHPISTFAPTSLACMATVLLLGFVVWACHLCS